LFLIKDRLLLSNIPEEEHGYGRERHKLTAAGMGVENFEKTEI
jgi:hypothetical protein